MSLSFSGDSAAMHLDKRKHLTTEPQCTKVSTETLLYSRIICWHFDIPKATENDAKVVRVDILPIITSSKIPHELYGSAVSGKSNK
jgi:hypothetical protein